MIKNIIFDFGDIFIDLDKGATLKKMSGFGLKGFTAGMEAVNHRYEKGLITTPAYVDFYLKLYPNARRDEFIKAWNAIILKFPEHRLKWIEKLSEEKKYRLFLLSNTNALHIDKVIEQMGTERYERFKNCFEKFYLSHEINLRKPDTDIYSFVLNENKLVPEETCFIDDTKKNTDAALSLGIQCWNLIPGKEDITNLFNQPTFSL